jgi:transcriptional regulator with XRE-family HTH domain
MKCTRCDGTGKEPDQKAIGATMKLRRVNAGVGLREMARRLGCSHTNVKLLEKGERRWTPEFQNLYRIKTPIKHTK